MGLQSLIHFLEDCIALNIVRVKEGVDTRVIIRRIDCVDVWVGLKVRSSVRGWFPN
jgi:hypothetical protein